MLVFKLQALEPLKWNLIHEAHFVPVKTFNKDVEMTKFLWILRMAIRDSRGSRGKLLLFVSSMILGVAALVAISSFGENLKEAVDDEALTLLGADLSIENRDPFPKRVDTLIDSIGGEQSYRVSFASMVYFPSNGGTRLSTVRALEGNYPYYGAVETDPPEAAGTYQDTQGALVEGSLLKQFDLTVGDSVRVGRKTYRIDGEIIKTPRETSAMGMLSPRVFIPYAGVDTLLLSRGSRARYEMFFKFEEGRDVEALVAKIEPVLRAERVGFDTITERQEDWNEGLTNLYRFLNMVGFIALLLGGVGIASAVHVYIKQRIKTVAILRCLGSQSGATFGVYLVQASVMGGIAALIGSVLGIGIQFLIPRLLADFLPVEVDIEIMWVPVITGLAIGLGVSLLFALLPLLAVKNTSPLLTLRKNVDTSSNKPSRWRFVIYATIVAAIFGFAMLQAPIWELGAAYGGAIFIVFGLLWLVAKGITVFSRRYFPSSWPYPWRQGFSNLYRPNNQTVILMLSLGLGTFLIVTMFLVQQILLKQIEIAGGDGRPNLVFFDIQPGQLEAVSASVAEKGLPILEEVPLITMRITRVNGRTLEQIRQDSTRDDYTWAHGREYQSTYRGMLSESETLVEGDFAGYYDGQDEYVPVSIEEDVAGELNVSVGDTIEWNVQGLPVKTKITSVRKVDWQRVQTNFFFVFPEGVLENAPQFYVLLTRAEDENDSASMQSAVVNDFPNVSAIDLSLVLNVFDAIYSRISFVLRFMALFSIVTGIIVLISAVSVSRYQRIEESVLLKTLGASRSQIIRILFVEYLFLGVLAALTGVVLSVVCAWLMAQFVFESPFYLSGISLIGAVLIVALLTIGVGMFNSRGIYDRPTLEVLRATT